MRQQFSLCFRARYRSGEPTQSDESSDVRWVRRGAPDALPIHQSMRLRIDHGYQKRVETNIGETVTAFPYPAGYGLTPDLFGAPNSAWVEPKPAGQWCRRVRQTPSRQGSTWRIPPTTGVQ